jgi:hypothetical protein
VQLGVFRGLQLKTHSAGGSIAQVTSANLERLVFEFAFKKQFSRICTIAQKPP